MQTRWGIFWVLTFLGFPIGGALALLLIGQMENPIEGLVGGAVVGIVVGGAQMFALRGRLPIDWRWISATAAAMAVGVGLSVAIFRTETTREAILIRAALIGLLIGAAQWFMLKNQVRSVYRWIIVVIIGYTAAWAVTSLVIGNFVDQGFVVFGSSGALAYQVLTYAALRQLTIQQPVYSKA